MKVCGIPRKKGVVNGNNFRRNERKDKKSAYAQ